MNYLLDTHILLWSSYAEPKLPKVAADIISDPENVIWASVISLWEVAIKSARRKPDFRYEVEGLREGLFRNGYMELSMESRHVLELNQMPRLHSDPFDRMMVAQAISEGFIFLTSDRQLAQYSHLVQFLALD